VERVKTSIREEWEEYRQGALILKDADENTVREALRHFMAGASTVLEILADAEEEKESVAILFAVAAKLRKDVCRFAGLMLRGKA
jgi:hypothetical protein